MFGEKTKRRMMNDERKELFQPNACQVCQKYGKTVNLKRCSNCKMIAYCSREHQQQHWLFHKDICRIIGKMNKQFGSILAWKDKMDCNEQSWYKFKEKLLFRIQSKLNRKVLHSEMAMILFPRSCLVCHETDPEKLTDCQNCPSFSFCHKHANQDHRNKCDKSRLSFQLQTEPYEMLYLSPYADIGVEIPKDMEDVIRFYKTAYDIDETKLLSKLEMIRFTEVFTRSYTLLYALKKISFSRPYINLHVVGTDEGEEKTVDHCEVLLHYIKSLKDLEVTLIGPSLENQGTFYIKLCKNCEAKEATILIKNVPKLYHDYAKSKEYTKPDIIAGFNLGIHEIPAIGDTWSQTIKEIEKQRCPFFMTSYTLREQKEDQKKINDTLNRNVKFACSEKNPFSSLRPVTDFETEDFFFSNDYLTVYENL